MLPTPITSAMDYQTRGNDKFSSSNYNVSNFHYPKNLMEDSSNTYGNNYIVFYINVQTDSKVRLNSTEGSDFVDPSVSVTSGVRSDATRSGAGTLGKTGLVAGAAGGALIAGGGAAALGTLVSGGGLAKAVGSAVKVGGGAALLSGGAASLVMLQGGSANRATKRLKSAIALHNPNMISTTYATSWNPEDTAKEAMAMMQFGGDMSGTGGGSLDQLIAQAKSSGGGVAGAATNIALTNGPNKSLLSAKSGLAANAKKEMIFSGVDFRTFTFDYKFAPTCNDELIMAKNIIKMFKFHMHPEYVPGQGNYLYVYPSEFDIMYYNNGVENRNLPRYASCVLTRVSVNYTPNGNFTSFANGAPTHMDLLLEFKELAALTKAEIADGY